MLQNGHKGLRRLSNQPVDGGVSQLRRLLDLLDDHGATALAAAIDAALTPEAPSAGTIAHLLDHHRRQQRLPPVVPLILPNHPGVHDLTVQSHALETYDALSADPDRDRDPE